ncbi:hypothetical protein D6C90_07294 [Aureobasidium pullulans]|uniref:Uncharacterized protein n=1 Tax=Aureobasidium pullulans TaxID=5580 RepID=A0A4S9UDQ1_AURPU|nr:hypothetical protein D6C90_07294 [Aureobasidium pullulans]
MQRIIRLRGVERDLIQAMFHDDCDVNTVSKVMPHAPRSTLYRMQKNIDLFGQVRKPSSAIKRMGAPRKITPLMREYLIDLLSERNDLWQEELVFELWCQFDVAVDKSTISRLLKEEELSNKVNTRIASRQSNAQQGVYLEQLAELMGQGLDAGIEPMDMLLYLDESACSEKVMFRRRSWSQIGLPAYTSPPNWQRYSALAAQARPVERWECALRRRTLYSIQSSLRLLLKLSFFRPMEPLDQVSDRLVRLLKSTSTGPHLIAPSASDSKDDLIMTAFVRKTGETSA